MTITILYLHGWQSLPGGAKPAWLEQQGICVIQPALPSDDFEESLTIAHNALHAHDIDVIVGSSRGGAIAANLNDDQRPRVLLCPAWKRWGTAYKLQTESIILHAMEDDIIPYGDSLELLANSGLHEKDHLVTTGHDHRLADDNSLRHLLQAIRTLGH